jgi:poly-beta-1,6-N-acetyl-D-glucosamine synthase
VTTPDWLTLMASAGVAYLLVAYAIGGPIVLGRTLAALFGRRRQRYRALDDDVLASSRFTIPVSVLLPTGGDLLALDALPHLLAFEYPEFEVIVVNDGSVGVLEALRDRYDLKAYEVFFRRTLPTSTVRGIYRSGTTPQLLVVDCLADSPGDALNCGINLARYRYVCCGDAYARYMPQSLLQAMLPAVEDPALVTGVTTVLGAAAGEAAPDGAGRVSATLQRLSSLRKLLARLARRQLSLWGDTAPGFALWRRDAVVEAGGFATDVEAVHLEMTFRLHRHMRLRKQAQRIVHVTGPVGAPAIVPSVGSLLERKRMHEHAVARMFWRYKGMVGNPRYGALGLIELPRYLFNAAVTPWMELAALAALPLALVAGVLSASQFVLVVAAVALGNAVLLGAGLLVTPVPDDERERVHMLALAPLEVFLWRPLQLYSRLSGLLRLVRPGRTART